MNTFATTASRGCRIANVQPASRPETSTELPQFGEVRIGWVTTSGPSQTSSTTGTGASRVDPRHAGAAAGPGCSGRRNCNVLLDDLHWDRPDLDCEPQPARGIPRNLQLDETPAFMV